MADYIERDFKEAYVKMKERALEAEQEIWRLREALKLTRTGLMVAIREIDRELEFPLQESSKP